jgi:hypothetical protein
VGGAVQLGALCTAATNRPIVPAQGDYDDGEIGEMIGRENRRTRRKPAPIAALSTKNPTWCLDANSGRRVGKPATKRLSYGTARQDFVYVKVIKVIKIKVIKNKTVLNHTPDFRYGSGVSSIFRRKDFLRHLRIERCQVAAMNVHLEHKQNYSCPQEGSNHGWVILSTILKSRVPFMAGNLLKL